ERGEWAERGRGGERGAPWGMGWRTPLSISRAACVQIGSPRHSISLFEHRIYPKTAAHMWTALCLQEPWQSADRIACDHMSGLLSRSHMTAAKMVSATRVPNTFAAL